MYAVTKRKRWEMVFGIVLCSFFEVLCIAFPTEAATGLRGGLDLCYRAIIPSMFPFLFVGRYLFSRLSLLPGRSSSILCCLVFSLVGGFPMGARSLRSLTENHVLTTKQASLLLTGAVNAGPAFLISSVGGTLFGSTSAGLMLFVALTVASLFCFILFVVVRDRVMFEKAPSGCKTVSPKAPISMTKALEESVHATLGMCGYVSLFSCVLALVRRLVTLSPMASYFVASSCEVSNGCKQASEIGGTLGLYLACGAVSFCGVSVLLQVRSVLADSGISMRTFLLLRPLHCGVSLIVLRALLAGDAVTETFAAASVVAAKLFSINPSFSLFLLLTGIVFVMCSKRITMARPI